MTEMTPMLNEVRQWMRSGDDIGILRTEFIVNRQQAVLLSYELAYIDFFGESDPREFMHMIENGSAKIYGMDVWIQ